MRLLLRRLSHVLERRLPRLRGSPCYGRLLYPGLREGARAGLLRPVPAFSMRHDHDPAPCHRAGQGLAGVEEEKRKKRGIGRNGLPRRRRRGSMAAVILWGSFAHIRGPKVSKGQAESPLVRPQVQAFCRWGLTRQLWRG